MTLKVSKSLAALIILLSMQCLKGSAWAGDLFTNKILRGTCIWQSTGFVTTSGAAHGAGPATGVHRLTFDGRGHLKVDSDTNIDGTFDRETGLTGTYQLDPDGSGHGTFSYFSPAVGTSIIVDFYLTPRGTAIRTIFQSYADERVSQRVVAGACRFDE